jgi:tetratricopeptide (TPR) repeat protein
MEQDSGLKEAKKLLLQGKYSIVINQLSSQIFMYRNNLEFYWILGMACFSTKDWGGAYSYFKRGEDLNGNDPRFKEALALIYLRRRENQKALLTWLELLELNPNNKKAISGLELVRSTEDIDWPYELDQGKYNHLYPNIPKQTNLGLISAIAGVAIITLGLIISLIIPSATAPEYQRPGIEILLEADKISELGDFSEFAEIILTDMEIEQLSNDIKNNFNDKKDNLVRYQMNRLLRSNASNSIKENYARVLPNLKAPNLSEDFFNPNYLDILDDPPNYDTVYVKLRGLAANVRNSTGGGELNLLVGYETKENLLGEMPVQIPFDFEISGGQALEVLGQIQIVDDEIYLLATSLRRIVP